MKSTPHAGYPPDGTVFRDRVIEVLLITFLLLEVWFLYAPLGALIAQRGVNKAPVLMTALDNAIPYVPEPVFAYRMAFVVVPIALVYFIIAWFQDVPQFRSMALAYFLILVLAFVIYWMFPSASSRTGHDLQARMEPDSRTSGSGRPMRPSHPGTRSHRCTSPRVGSLSAVSGCFRDRSWFGFRSPSGSR